MEHRIVIENGRIRTEGLAPREETNTDELRRQAAERGFVQLRDGTVVITSGRRVG